MVGSPIDVNGIELEMLCLCHPYWSVGETLGRMKRVALTASSNQRSRHFLEEFSSGKTPAIILKATVILTVFLTVHCKMVCLMLCFTSRDCREWLQVALPVNDVLSSQATWIVSAGEWTERIKASEHQENNCFLYHVATSTPGDSVFPLLTGCG